MSSVLAYWDTRGLAQPIRLLLNYVGEEFEDKYYSCGPAPDFSKDAWLKVKFTLDLDFPNLAYYKDDKVNISQSWTILRYLGRKHKVDATTEDEKLRADLARDQLSDVRSTFSALCYSANFDSLKDDYIASLPSKLQPFEQFLGDRQWFAGDKITWVDFPIYEFLAQLLIFKADCVDSFPKLKAFVQRFEALPQIKKYRESDKFLERPINNKRAAFK